ncbi:MAG: selenocysteine-specific translation elongation factor, partial [Chloroflexota bacterium]|nr:selenocysteine-specific translation elongation factor [Chloroflexota bacterium]
MFVIGTAGHVDHGKSTLVRAITGIDPDRLQEEKDRGMTIDLGFAWFSLPGGQEISIVDVPGHEKFVNNMLAGVAGIDMAMLVVAADEGVMPQTREHLAILDLLKIPVGIVVLSKIDLVNDEWVDLVTMDIEELTEGSVLEDSSVYPVSAETGAGIEDLIDAIDEMFATSENRPNNGRPRLPVDRAFTVSGFGTVVTGTLLDGSLEIGQEIEMSPSGHKGRIRGLQSHKKKENMVLPGTRVAANISGIDQDQIRRGEVLTVPGWLRSSEAFDVKLDVLDDVPNILSHNMFVTLHTGSSEVIARLRLLEDDKAEPGFSYWAQIKPNTSTPVVKGDYFVIRSNMTTLGGGVVVDTHAKRHRRKYVPTIKRLELLESDAASDIILSTLESSEGSPLDAAGMADKSGINLSEVRSELFSMEEGGLIVEIGGGLYYSSFNLEKISSSVVGWISEYHDKFPLRMGAQREELRSRLNLAN